MQSNFYICQSKRRLSLLAIPQNKIENVEQAPRLLSVERKGEYQICSSSFLQPQSTKRNMHQVQAHLINEGRRCSFRSHTPVDSLRGIHDTTELFYKKMINSRDGNLFQIKISSEYDWKTEDHEQRGKFLIKWTNFLAYPFKLFSLWM